MEIALASMNKAVSLASRRAATSRKPAHSAPSGTVAVPGAGGSATVNSTTDVPSGNDDDVKVVPR
ncbi:hypothetical protein D3C87_1910490 [compost metagenome]